MSDPLVANAGDVEQVVKAGKTVKARESRRLADLQLLLQTQHGVRFVACLLESTKLLSPSPNMGTNDGLQYFSGLSMIGTFLIADLRKLEPKYMVAVLAAMNQKESYQWQT